MWGTHYQSYRNIKNCKKGHKQTYINKLDSVDEGKIPRNTQIPKTNQRKSGKYVQTKQQILSVI